MTQVIKIRQMILDGPIRNANDIILNDIKDLYIHLINEIKKISSDIATHRNKTIELSKANNAIESIKLIEKEIIETKKYNLKQAEILSDLLAKLENNSRTALNKIKS